MVAIPARPGANLVLAHGACNSRKSDLLGGEAYLERWVDFVSDHDSDLLQLGTKAGLLVDRATSFAVAEWSYGHAERVQAEVWLGGKEYGHLFERVAGTANGLGENYGNRPSPCRSAMRGRSMNDDVYVAPQFREAIHELSLGDPPKLSTQSR